MRFGKEAVQRAVFVVGAEWLADPRPGAAPDRSGEHRGERSVRDMVRIDIERPRMEARVPQSAQRRIVGVTRGATTSHVRLDIGGAVVTASIINEAVDDLSVVQVRRPMR